MINIDNNRSINNNINDCGKNFRTPLTPLHRGGLEGIHSEDLEKLRSNWLKDIYSNGLRYAFSLIELSIVLIIIGLLVAGVTGGKSLIDSARSRALINELREYERAVWTFRAARDRFPGDVMNYGTFGVYSNYQSGYAEPYHAYDKSDFAAPYDTGSFTPNHYSAPFVDLYTEGIIDFKPLGNSVTADKNSTTKGVPNLKSRPTAYLYFIYTGGASGGFSGEACTQDQPYCFYKQGLSYEGGIQEVLYIYGPLKKGLITDEGLGAKLAKSIDVKLDDGIFNTGKVRGGCFGLSGTGGFSNSEGNTNYDYAIKRGYGCKTLYYAI